MVFPSTEQPLNKTSVCLLADSVQALFWITVKMSTSKPPLTRLSELAPGQRGDFFALLADRTRGLTREGKPYYHCRFRDARRTASLMVWSDDKWFERLRKRMAGGAILQAPRRL